MDEGGLFPCMRLIEVLHASNLSTTCGPDVHVTHFWQHPQVLVDLGWLVPIELVTLIGTQPLSMVDEEK